MPISGCPQNYFQRINIADFPFLVILRRELYLCYLIIYSMDWAENLSSGELKEILRAQIKVEENAMEERLMQLENRFLARRELAELKMHRNLMTFRIALRNRYMQELKTAETDMKELGESRKAAFRAMMEHIFADMSGSNDKTSRRVWCTYDFRDCQCWRCKKVRERKRPPPAITVSMQPVSNLTIQSANISPLMIESEKNQTAT